MNKQSIILYWGARLIAALLMVQTLYFKFTGSAESVYIFKTIGMEPWGRFGIGVLEMIAAVLLLFNRTAWLGGGLAFGLMVGAIGMHFTTLGISIQDDGGYLFFLAVVVAVCSAYVLLRNKDKIVSFIKVPSRS